MKKILISLSLFNIVTLCSAQLSANFVTGNDGYNYLQLSNPTSYVLLVNWSCINYAKNQAKNGQFYIQSGESAYFGPSTIGWFWEDGEVFNYSIGSGNTRSISFRRGCPHEGHCRNCGLDHYGNYICPYFRPKSGHPSECKCGCPKQSHACYR